MDTDYECRVDTKPLRRIANKSIVRSVHSVLDYRSTCHRGATLSDAANY
jgi:hypothetical protein